MCSDISYVDNIFFFFFFFFFKETRKPASSEPVALEMRTSNGHPWPYNSRSSNETCPHYADTVLKTVDEGAVRRPDIYNGRRTSAQELLLLTFKPKPFSWEKASLSRDKGGMASTSVMFGPRNGGAGDGRHDFRWWGFEE